MSLDMSTMLPPPESGICQRSLANSATDAEKSKSTLVKRRPLYSPRRVLIFHYEIYALLNFGFFMIPIIYILYRTSAQYLVFEFSRLACRMKPKPNVVGGNEIKFTMWSMFREWYLSLGTSREKRLLFCRREEETERSGRTMDSLERRG